MTTLIWHMGIALGNALLFTLIAEPIAVYGFGLPLMGPTLNAADVSLGVFLGVLVSTWVSLRLFASGNDS